MSSFSFKIKTDNAAFDGTDALRGEVASILRQLAARIEVEESRIGDIRDSNGNTVGFFGFTGRAV